MEVRVRRMWRDDGGSLKIVFEVPDVEAKMDVRCPSSSNQRYSIVDVEIHSGNANLPPPSPSRSSSKSSEQTITGAPHPHRPPETSEIERFQEWKAGLGQTG